MNILSKSMAIILSLIAGLHAAEEAMEETPALAIQEENVNIEPTLPSSAIQKISENLYVRQKERDLCFVMERLDESNLEFWSRFETKEGKLARKWHSPYLSGTSPFICPHLLAGYIGFKDALSHYFCNRTSPHEVWIIFALNAPTIHWENERNSEMIEMYCTVSTSSNVRFITHMGISRCAQFINKFGNGQKHPHIAMDLHIFGVTVMAKRYTDKLYLITTPMPHMEKIFKDFLGKENVHIVFDEDWPHYINQLQQEICRMEKDINNVDENDLNRSKRTLLFYQNKLSDSGEKPLLTIDTRGSCNSKSFLLKDLSGNIIMDLNKEEMYTQYFWYFDRETTFSPYNNMIVIPLHTLLSKNL